MTTQRDLWREVTPDMPCEVCGKGGWCRRSPDGNKIACRRESRGAVRTKTYKNGEVAYLHVLRDDRPPGGNGKPRRERPVRGVTPAASDAPVLQPTPTADGDDLARRDAAYRRLLALLPVSPNHRDALRARGLSDADIDAGGYRTLPAAGRAAVLRTLVADLGADYAAMPGLVIADGRPRIAAPAGLLVPVRDLAGRIVALKVRADAATDGGGKYLYLSSSRYGGPSPGSPAHVPARVSGPAPVVRITEGELKADVAYRLSGVPTVSFPGVASWRVVLPVLRDLQARTVRVAFDADGATNANVARCLRDCCRDLQAAGYAVELERWSQDAGKGIDDVLQAGRAADIEVLTGPEALQAADIAMAAGVDDDDSDGDADGEERERPKSVATLLVELAAVAELWHTTGQGIAYATLPVGDHREHWPVRSLTFRRWLGRQFFEQYGKAPGGQALQDALTVVEGQALFDGAERPVFVRVAGHDGRLYLDLANDDWHVVEIDAAGCRIVKACPVRFRRAKAMLPLPTPTAGGNIGELRRYVNVTDGDWALVLGWLVAAFRQTGPYPVLALHGEHGSAKSTTARVLRACIDPNAAPVRCEPREPRDLMIAANNGWVIALDNLSYVSRWLSDALCRLATGGGFAARQLFTDDDESIFNAMRPGILTGIEEVATRPDLLDRLLILQLPSIPDEQRRTEQEFWREFEQAHGRILGAVLDAVSAAIRNLPTTHNERWPRMADFAKWATAAETGLGLQPREFLATYRGNRNSANETALESSPVAKYVLQVAEAGDWHGTPSELLQHIESVASDGDKRLKVWPKSPRALSGILQRLAPNLRAASVEVAHGRDVDRQRRRFVTVRRTEGDSCVRTVRTVANRENCAVSADAADANSPVSDANGIDAKPDGATVRTQTDAADAKLQPCSDRVRVTI